MKIFIQVNWHERLETCGLEWENHRKIKTWNEVAKLKILIEKFLPLKKYLVYVDYQMKVQFGAKIQKIKK